MTGRLRASQGTQLVREGSRQGARERRWTSAQTPSVSSSAESRRSEEELPEAPGPACMRPHPRSEPPSVSREAGTSLLGPSSYSCIQPCSFRTAVSLSTSIITDAPITSSSASFSCEGLDFDLPTRDSCHSHVSPGLRPAYHGSE